MYSVRNHTQRTLFLNPNISVPPSILPGLSVLGSAAGNPLTLECIVESYPKSFVVWSIGGRGDIFPKSLEK